MGITIPGGDAVERNGLGYRVPKKDLVSAVRLLLDGGRLAWPASMPEAEVLEAELRTFRTKITAALHDTYNAREGTHDDLLLALAVACRASEHGAYATAVAD